MLSKAYGLMNSLACYGLIASPLTPVLEKPHSPLCVGVEVMILLKIRVLSFQTSYFDKENNKRKLLVEHNLLEQKRNEVEL